MIKKIILFLLLTSTTIVSADSAEPKYIVISGGGAKGIVLLGAFEVLLDAPGFRAPIEHLIGSSVGAIAASVIAAGATVEQIQSLQRMPFHKLIGAQPIMNSGNTIMHFIREQLKWSLQTQLMNDPISEEVIAQLSDADQWLYDNLLDHLNPYLPIEKTCITFAMLDLLHRLDPAHFKALSITATCVNVDAKHAAFTLNYHTSPHLDIALACRASISLPLFFHPVSIPRSCFNPTALPKELGKHDPKFVDGGWLNNVPVRVLEESLQDPLKVQQLREDTWIFVYEDALQDNELSIFHPDRALPSYSFLDQCLLDGLIPLFSGFPHLPSATKSIYQELLYFKRYYPHIISFPVALSTVDFKEAVKQHKYYTELGKEIARKHLCRNDIRSSD